MEKEKENIESGLTKEEKAMLDSLFECLFELVIKDENDYFHGG